MPTNLAPPAPPWPLPALPRVEGRFVTVTPYDAARDADALFAALCGTPALDALWTHLPIGPFASAADLAAALAKRASDPVNQSRFHVFRRPTDETPHGMSSFMRLRPEHGSAEIGAVVFGPTFQRTPAATEAMFILIRHIFADLGYRRLEWKCDTRNAASARAGARFGFLPEGVFRNDMWVKGRSRDTAWFAMTDTDYPRVAAAFVRWLDPQNFDASGQQRQTLQDVRAALPEGSVTREP